jgi:hypothetical protein
MYGRVDIPNPRSKIPGQGPLQVKLVACTRRGCDSGKCFIGVSSGQRRVGVSIFVI